jgi:hypothetical protein
VSASDQSVKSVTPDPQPFERAKLPMILAAVGITLGLAISGSLDRTPAHAGDPAPSVPFGGAVVRAGWVVGIAALHRLGRAGSMPHRERSAQPAPPRPAPSNEAKPVVDDEGEHDEGDDDDDDDLERKR